MHCMGLFGSSPDGEVDELIENANHLSKHFGA